MKLADEKMLTERTNLMLSKNMKEELREEAKKQGVPIAEIMRVALGQYLKKRKK